MARKKIGIIGLGLIGGSIAKALRKHFPDCEIIAFDENFEALMQSLDENIIDNAVLSVSAIANDFRELDIIYLCTPVQTNLQYIDLLYLGGCISDTTILTDVGSVKSDIHEAIKNSPIEANFIGGHPMAGSEKSGYKHSNELLFENVYYVLTYNDKVSKDLVDTMKELVTAIGAVPIDIDYKLHDYVTGLISHLPHVIASGLVNLVAESDEGDLMKLLAAGGFKDITRIASSSPRMWSQICLENKENLITSINDFITVLNDIKWEITTDNTNNINSYFNSAREYRNSLPKAKAASMDSSFILHCDIKDEMGAIAKVSNILAENAVSIKNIGIIHNREYENGALRLELYAESAYNKAITLLEENGYTVYPH